MVIRLLRQFARLQAPKQSVQAIDALQFRTRMSPEKALREGDSRHPFKRKDSPEAADLGCWDSQAV